MARGNVLPLASNAGRIRVEASRSMMVAAVIAGALVTGCAPESPTQERRLPGPAATTAEATTSRPPTSVASNAGRVTRIDDLTVPRAVHTATMLGDGRVLIVGGCSRNGCGGNERALASVLFDPASNEFTPGPTLTTARAGHTATSLLDGRVLIVGGYEAEGEAPLASAEVFDPAAKAAAITGSLAQGRGGHTASLLPDGRVLIVGGTGSEGEPLRSVEIYDPHTRVFGAAAPLPEARASHAAVTVDGGEVLVVGGRSQRRGPVIASTVRYDAAADRWDETAELNEARNKHAVVPVLGGGALAIGGATEQDFDERLTSVELWDPVSSRWVMLGNLAAGRFKLRGAAAVLADGRVVVAGGGTSVEVVDPHTGEIGVAAGALEIGPLFATATTLADGRVLILGGYDEEIRVLAHAYVYER